MDLFFILLPALFIVVLYFVIFPRKGEARKAKSGFAQFDWITNLSVLFGVLALLNGLAALNINYSPVWAMILAAVLFVLLLGIIIYRIRKGQPIIKCVDDERTSQIYAKSSRNALFVMFLGLLIIVGRDTSLLSTKWVVVTLGAGLVTLFTSLFVYYFRKS